jgi:hypothetical protein
MRHAHLTEDQLIAMCLAGQEDARAFDTACGCDTCGARLSALSALLDEVSVGAELETDAAFPDDRLARQRARILNRLAHQGQVARVIAFPTAHGQHTSMPPRSARRWVAGAAAAGLVIGMMAGHLAHELPSLRPIARQETSMLARSGSVAPLLASTSSADDDFLREIEVALRYSPQGLRRLDLVTPVAWEQSH